MHPVENAAVTDNKQQHSKIGNTFNEACLC